METDVNDKMHQIAEGTEVSGAQRKRLASTRTLCNQLPLVYSLLSAVPALIQDPNILTAVAPHFFFFF